MKDFPEKRLGQAFYTKQSLRGSVPCEGYTMPHSPLTTSKAMGGPPAA